MHEHNEKPPQRRVEYRVVCAHENGTEAIWKYAETLDIALHYLKTVDPKYQARYKWFIYEAQICETLRTVYTLDSENVRKTDRADAN